MLYKCSVLSYHLKDIIIKGLKKKYLKMSPKNNVCKTFPTNDAQSVYSYQLSSLFATLFLSSFAAEMLQM